MRISLLRMTRPTISTVRGLGVACLLGAAMVASPAAACFNCNLISVPFWPYQAWGCDPAGGPGYEGCVSDGWSWCDTYGDSCVGDGWGCFLAGTVVSTPDGDRPIESLEVGDAIWCVGSDGARVAGEVTRTYQEVSHGYYLLNGSIRVTGMHRFLTGPAKRSFDDGFTATTSFEQHPLGAWTPMSKLDLGQELRTIGGGSRVVETIEFVDRGVRVFNLEVSPHHNYFAEGVLVHNRKPDIIDGGP